MPRCTSQRRTTWPADLRCLRPMSSRTSFRNRLLRPSAKGGPRFGLHPYLAHERHVPDLQVWLQAILAQAVGEVVEGCRRVPVDPVVHLGHVGYVESGNRARIRTVEGRKTFLVLNDAHDFIVDAPERQEVSPDDR